jgi:hypothetical protein
MSTKKKPLAGFEQLDTRMSNAIMITRQRFLIFNPLLNFGSIKSSLSQTRLLPLLHLKHHAQLLHKTQKTCNLLHQT